MQVYSTQGKITKLSSPRLLAVLAELELAERLAESNTVDGLLDDVGAGAVDLADEALAVSVDNKTKQVGAHVVAAEVVESLAEVGLVKVDVDVDEALEVLGRLGDQRLAVRAVDAGVAVVDVVVFGSLARWGLEGDTGGRDCLERRQSEGGGLDGERGGHDIGVGIADVGVRVRVLQSRSVRVQWPGSNVDLHALGDGVSLARFSRKPLSQFWPAACQTVPPTCKLTKHRHHHKLLSNIIQIFRSISKDLTTYPSSPLSSPPAKCLTSTRTTTCHLLPTTREFSKLYAIYLSFQDFRN